MLLLGGDANAKKKKGVHEDDDAMGADGGSVPRRDELVKTKGRAVAAQAVTSEAERARWKVCALSKEPLCEPIVADDLGHLFNKDAVVRALLAHTLPAELGHIRGLRDLYPARLTRNPATGDVSPFICPVTRNEAGVGGARGRLVLVVPCGCCVSEAAFVEVPYSASTVCIVCGAAVDTARGPIVLNGTRDDMARAAERLAARRQQKQKPRHSTPPAAATGTTEDSGPVAKRQRTDSDSAPAPAPVPAPAPAAIPKGARESVFRSLFHRQQDAAERSEDLFLCRAGFCGVLK